MSKRRWSAEERLIQKRLALLTGHKDCICTSRMEDPVGTYCDACAELDIEHIERREICALTGEKIPWRCERWDVSTNGWVLTDHLVEP